MTEKLFTPIELGALRLPNRVLMAPLTRNRARRDGDVPQPMNVEYYRQRASAGLIISEGTQVSPEGKGYIDTPGIYSKEQVAGWRPIADAVHEAGGRIVAQLWHVGRISHNSLLPSHGQPVAPSAIPANTKTFIEGGFAQVSDPRALKTDEIARVVEDFAHAAQCAKEAGFDGAELHGANGYLIDQFLRDSTNQRDDDYGGSAQNRSRFLVEVVRAVSDVLGGDRVGLRIAPFSSGNDISDSDPVATFGTAIEAINQFGLAYLHVVEGQIREDPDASRELLHELRSRFSGAYVANNGYTRERAFAALNEGRADAIAFGRPFIANPDLPRRLELGTALNEPDRDTFYGGGAHGYTDYPFLGEQASRSA